jgi:hypothetical protein
MTVKIKAPYKIAPEKIKRYATHYNIPADRSLVVPMRAFDDEVACDIRWEDDNGELQWVQNKIFVVRNLVPLNPLLDIKLQELWHHFYALKQSPE